MSVNRTPFFSIFSLFVMVPPHMDLGSGVHQLQKMAQEY